MKKKTPTNLISYTVYADPVVLSGFARVASQQRRPVAQVVREAMAIGLRVITHAAPGGTP